MIDYSAAVGYVAVAMSLLMVVAMLYLVWDALEDEVHMATPDESEGPALGGDDEAADSDETQAELTADGNSA